MFSINIKIKRQWFFNHDKLLSHLEKSLYTHFLVTIFKLSYLLREDIRKKGIFFRTLSKRGGVNRNPKVLRYFFLLLSFLMATLSS